MPRGEFELIDAFRARLPLPGWRVEVGSGDDAAVVRVGGTRSVVSVDTTVDGTHARLDLGDPLEAARAFGWRALTTALSDLAACGTRPGEAYVALTVPRAMPDEVLLALGDGLGDAAREYGVDVVGGDVTSGPVVVASVTVVGWLEEEQQPLTRGGADPGDLVGLTGAVGRAGAGLALELSLARDTCVSAKRSEQLRQAHRRPVPRTDAGAALRAAGATAAIDLSDGLLADAGHVARASGVVLEFEAAAVPLGAGVAEVAEELGSRSALAFAEAAGEDFELLVTVPPSRRAEAEAAGVVAWIGEVRARRDGEPSRVLGLPEPHGGRAGHDHRA
jgi:thiamine-monophosphate kinase